MKSLIVFALVALVSFGARAQQSMLDPATSNQTLVVEVPEQLPTGDIVTAGFVGSNAHICRTTLSGVLAWSKTCNNNSAFYGLTSMSDGNFIAVGTQTIDPQGSSGLVVKFGPGGNIIWSKTFAAGDSTVVFRSVVVDPNGRIHAYGDKSKSSNRREILVGFDPNGNFLCGTQLLSTGTTFFGRKLFIWEDHLYAFGESRSSGKGIGMTKFTLNDAFVSHIVFGGFGPNDNFLDAVQYQDKFVFSYWNANIPGTIMLARVNVDMEIEGSPVSINSGLADFWSLTLGNLGIGNAGEVYVSGAMAGNGFNSSFVLKTDVNLSPYWAKKLLFGSLPTRTASTKASGGGVIVAKTRNNNTPFANAGATVTKLSAAGDATASGYCHPPEAFSFELWNEFLPVYPQTRTPLSLTLSPGATSFSAYGPLVMPCPFSMLSVELVSFRGEQDGDAVELSWTTASELNNSHFNIMRSRDGVDGWEEIGSVTGVGTSQLSSDYKFRDEDPLSGGNYYQLVQVDIDGTETLSDMVFVNFERPLEVYPNPVASGETLQVKDGKAFQVLNAQGQVVLESVDGQATINLPPGLYVARSVEGDASAKVLVN